MGEPDIHITYSSPPEKRKLARGIFWGALLITALITWAVVRNYIKRAASGPVKFDPVDLVMFVGPLALVAIGLWIGWSQVRIDLKRGVFERRPLGLRLFARRFQLAEAKRIYVGYHRAPTATASANATIMMSSGKGALFWFARIEGEGYQSVLVAQRARAEALAYAEGLGEKFSLPVEVQEEP